MKVTIHLPLYSCIITIIIITFNGIVDILPFSSIKSFSWASLYLNQSIFNTIPQNSLCGSWHTNLYQRVKSWVLPLGKQAGNWRMRVYVDLGSRANSLQATRTWTQLPVMMWQWLFWLRTQGEPCLDKLDRCHLSDSWMISHKRYRESFSSVVFLCVRGSDYKGQPLSVIISLYEMVIMVRKSRQSLCRDRGE